MNLERIEGLIQEHVIKPWESRKSPEAVFKKRFGVDYRDPRAQERVFRKIENLKKQLADYRADDEVGPDVGEDIRAIARRDLASSEASASGPGLMLIRPGQETKSQS